MDAQRKSIQGLTISLDEKREELSAIYRQFGAKLLNDSIDGGQAIPSLVADSVQAWRSYLSERENDTQSVLDIKAALARMAELAQFRKELERTKNEASLAYEGRLEALGKLFHENGNTESAGAIWQAARETAGALSDLQDRQRQTREALEAAGFFGKMKAQFKLAGMESDIRQTREKLAKFFREGARYLVAGDFAEQLSAGTYGNDLIRAYEAAKEAAAHVEDISSREKTLDSDTQLVKTALEDAKALENPQRRMNELRDKIRDTDRRIDSHAALVAREYVDKFYDDEGRSRLGSSGEEPDSAGMGVYARQLEQVAVLRAEIASIRVKIEILETAIRIEALDRNINQWEHTVKDYEQRIKKYQELIVTTEQEIRDAVGERERMAAAKEALERGSAAKA